MDTFLSYADTTLGSCAATFIITMIFRQKIVDWFTGVPSHLRTGLKQIEAGVLDQVKNYEADLVAKIVPAAGKSQSVPDANQLAMRPPSAALLPEVPAAT